ncbi:hypothetical protein SAMN04487895_101484 [Paenibacillus sophorae]|uniref:ParM/StbA family protein n=1 Tax=Paenibacillus sophorae TaxID=1333845 RepID=A0A1H8GEE6_9BACL|nr:ParM/StbA family protein [Paenibacillus sophorae]QWU14194.1 ParM/StbA family protein [Paenibacillus sophorae]SEN42343.1 hypothetical protein SAMN04487895_101484 [Paenibacillus sophorae]
MSNICALDLGFGWTKGSYNNRVYLQPSIIGESKELFDDSIKPDDFIYGEDQYFVGKLALRQSDIKYFTMKDNKAEASTSSAITETALGYLIGNSAANVISGLPIKFYFKQKEHFEESLMKINDKDKYTIKKGNRGSYYVNPKIINLKLTPQGKGIAMDYLLKDDGTLDKISEAKKNILVIDLGFFTLNLLGLSKMETMKESTTLLLGVDNAYKLLQSYIQKAIGKSPARYELDPFVVSGVYEGYNIKPFIEKAFKSLANQIQNEIDGLNINFDLYLVAGGAAHQIIHHLNLPNKILLDQLSQVRGYRKMGERLWK